MNNIRMPRIKIIESIINELIKSRIKSREDLDCFKRKMAKKYKILCPSNVDLLEIYHKLVRKKRTEPLKDIEKLLRTRPIRSLSGIVNISVLTKPYPCPGKCIYCPSQKGIPKSYLKGEPAVQRAILTNFNPYLQVQTRLESLEKTGHPIDKIELRIIGGTWSYYPKQYQTWFVKRCFRAANNFNSKRKTKTQNLEEAQKKNEQAKCRIIGITIETRPDYVDFKEIKRMRNLGITGVELGVQSIYDDILKLNKRGHNIKSTIKATKLLKDVGFKVSYQMMPNLPGSDFKRDLKMFQELFSNPDFRPDLLKIYPLALLKEAPLYKQYKKGKIKVYSHKDLIKLLIEIKKEIPFWCRIQRIMRDIPSKDIIAGGAKISNLREVVQKEMREKGLKCKCIRCREVREDYKPNEKIYLFREDYPASGGKEIFLSFEDKKRGKLYALLRLRIPGISGSGGGQVGVRSLKTLPVLKNSAIIREVHTYGQMVPIKYTGLTRAISPQHKGFGKKLIREAEKITKKEFGLKKIAVISGVGVREYYSSKLGYKLSGTYMVKQI
jgi:elongator complex protein 3